MKSLKWNKRGQRVEEAGAEAKAQAEEEAIPGGKLKKEMSFLKLNRKKGKWKTKINNNMEEAEATIITVEEETIIQEAATKMTAIRGEEIRIIQEEISGMITIISSMTRLKSKETMITSRKNHNLSSRPIIIRRTQKR